jgi:type IX secretion system PorP/SprF family membrane protein
MRKLLTLVLLSGWFSINLQAQQQPVTDLYLFEGLAINPAFAGSQVQFSTTAVHRDQWVNFPGAPVTDMFSIHAAFIESKVGVGLMVTNDKIGIHNDLGVYGMFAYRITTSAGVLSAGLQGGFNNINTNFDKLNLKDANDNLLQGQVSALNPNFGAGLYFTSTNNRSHMGFSVPYILNSQFVEVESVLSEARRFRYYYLYGGTTFIVNENIKLKPAALLRFQEGAPLTFDITMAAVFYEVMKIGTTYRLNDNITFLVDMELIEPLHIGYAYEHTISEIRTYSSGTHEIMINFRFKSERLHGAGVQCPAYY